MAPVTVKIVEIGDPPPFPELGAKGVQCVPCDRVAILQGGTTSGLPSVAFLATLPDGSEVMLELTGRLLVTINGALMGAAQRWGVKL